MSKYVNVYTIPNNMPRARPRQPLVQIMDDTAYSGSITFHPRHAPHILRAIRAASKAAKAGRRIKPFIIVVSEPDQDYGAPGGKAETVGQGHFAHARRQSEI